MAVSRRNALTILGLAGAGGLIAEDIATPLPSLKPQTSGYHFGADRERVARALRGLADEIAAGETFAQELTVTSKIGLEDFLTHTLSVQFVVKGDADATS